jgi:hypothetical protein
MECKDRNLDCVAMLLVVDPWSRCLAEQQHWPGQRFDAFLALPLVFGFLLFWPFLAF